MARRYVYSQMKLRTKLALVTSVVPGGLAIGLGIFIYVVTHSIPLTLAVILLAVAGALLALWSMNSVVLKPVEELTKITGEFVKGNFSKRVKVYSQDELGQLGLSFNKMAESQQSMYGNLALRVEERIHLLKEEESRLRASIDSLAIGYVMTGPKNELILINRAAEAIFTLDTPTAHPAERVNDVTKLKGSIDLSFIRDALKDKVDITKQLTKSRELRKNIVLDDVVYKMLHLNLYITPVISQDSEEVIGSVLLITDITEQKVLERSRDEFFSIASHELRTPLTAIRGNTSLIRDYYGKEIKNKEVKKIIADVYDSSVRLIHIVNDFLDMSRLEQGKIQYKNVPFDIFKLCKEAVKEFDVTGSRKKIELRVDLPAKPLPLAYADEDRVRQIITNLLSNGIRFTSQGGVTISLEVLENHIKIYVIDTGEGIPPASQSLLFRKFQQAQSNILTRDASQSTGLGLYVSKIMARDMGGDIELEKSVVGKGSTFSLLLPIATTLQKAGYEKQHA
jgi:signal transduction histidine kinase/HAMP domain-containing protein